METVRITEDNIDEYEDIIDPDVAENIGREYFRGIAVHKDVDEDPEAVLVWEYKNLEESRDTEAEITWCKVSNEQSGQKLLEEYTAEAAESEVVKSFYELPAGDEDARKCLTEAGFNETEKEGRDIMVTVEELSELSFVKKRIPPYVTAISELMVRQFRKGITNCVFSGRRGLLEDLEFLPMSWYDEDVSCCVQTDGKVNGFLLVNKTASGNLVIDFLFARDPDARINLVYMIRFAVNAASEKYPPETKVILRRHNEETWALVDKLFPNKKGINVCYGERSED